MLNDITEGLNAEYWAELLIYSGGSIPAGREITFNSGKDVNLLKDFSVALGAEFTVYNESCDAIGFRDEEHYEQVKRKIEELLNKTKKN